MAKLFGQKTSINSNCEWRTEQKLNNKSGIPSFLTHSLNPLASNIFFVWMRTKKKKRFDQIVVWLLSTSAHWCAIVFECEYICANNVNWRRLLSFNRQHDIISKRAAANGVHFVFRLCPSYNGKYSIRILNDDGNGTNSTGYTMMAPHNAILCIWCDFIECKLRTERQREYRYLIYFHWTSNALHGDPLHKWN